MGTHSAGEIGRDLQPRLDASGDHDLWLKFTDYFKDKSLQNGSNLLALILGNLPQPHLE